MNQTPSTILALTLAFHRHIFEPPLIVPNIEHVTYEASSLAGANFEPFDWATDLRASQRHNPLQIQTLWPPVMFSLFKTLSRPCLLIRY